MIGKHIGPFAIESELGAGAMGAVYKARYTKTGQVVALKFILTALGSNPATQARFEREVEILKQLKHRNIVRLYASGRYEKSPFYAMEFLDGEPLDKILRRRSRLPWEEVVQIGIQLCAALEHAHEQGIIHRDLKPSNLMLLRDGTLKLTDFGIAKDLDVTQLTRSNATVGTAAYMSPEACQGVRALTNRSDLYSLGVVFYEMLTGKHPFVAETLLEMFLKHVEGTFERPSRVLLDVPVWMDNVVCRLMEKNPENRPASAALVGDMLEQVLKKVAEHKSAGQALSDTRVVDLVEPPRLTEEEKGVVRAIRGKPKRKKKPKPVYRQVWAQATAAGLALGLIALTIYVGTRTPSPEDLYAEFKAAVAAGKDGPARDGPVEKFIRLYPTRADDQAKDLLAWADRYDTIERERTFMNRFRRGVSDEVSTAETQARAAHETEESGDLEKARVLWTAVAANREEKDRKARLWGLLADKRVRDIDSAELQLTQIGRYLRQAEAGRLPQDPNPRVNEPVQYEISKDAPRAAKAWEALRDQAAKKSDERWLYLVAKQRLRELPK